MKIADFGDYENEVLLAGGIASNLHALEAFAVLAGDRPVILTGDIAAYAAHPADCIARVRDLGWPTIAGNVERQLARSSEDCGCGFEEGSACDRLSAAWYAHARTEVSDDQREWMSELPDLATFTQDGRRIAVIHGGVTDISRFLWPSSAAASFSEEVAALRELVGSVDAVVAGHCGIAFHRHVAGVQWINPGSLGLPPHDGRPETRFAVLKSEEITIERLSYDHEAARSAMQASGLTQGYHTTILGGIWPSEGVLPIELRR
jgi:predicted phosphodiesterase